MFINIFGKHSSFAEILCMLVIAGILGYLFHYLLSRKKWSLRINRLENKILNLESRFSDVEDIKDKQGLLFKNGKDMTQKINEFDALLGLTSEVDSISKTLNSLNFVSSKEFNQYVNEESMRAEEFRNKTIKGLDITKDEIKEEVNNMNSDLNQSLEDMQQKIDGFEEFSKTEMNSLYEKNSMEFDKIYSEMTNSNESSTEQFKENFNSIEQKVNSLSEKFDNQTWSSEIVSLDRDVEAVRKEVASMQGNYTNISSELGRFDQVDESFRSMEKKYDSLSSQLDHFDKIDARFDRTENDIKEVKNNYNKFSSLSDDVNNNIKKIHLFEDNINSLNDNYQAASKELDKVEHIDQKVKQHAKVILDLTDMQNSVSDMKSDIHNFSKELSKTDTQFNKVNGSVDSLEQLLKVHKHEGPDLTKIEASLYKLQNKQDELFLDYKKYGNDISFLKNKLNQKPKSTPAPTVSKAKAKSKKRMKMADRLSIKGIKVSSKDKDDLKKIKGVGPLIEKRMNKLGIYTFEQVSNLSRSDIELVNEAIEFFPGRIHRDNWKGQAKKLQRKYSKKAS